MPLTKIDSNKIQMPLSVGHYSIPTVLADAATVTPDLTVNNSFTWTITQNATLGFPGTIPGAGVWHLYLTQDPNGEHTLSFAAGYNLIDGTIETSRQSETLLVIVSDGSGTDLDVYSYQQTSTSALVFDIEYSARFNDNDSAYFTRTPGVTGDRRTWTISTWLKPTLDGAEQGIFGAATDSNNWFYCFFPSGTSGIYLNFKVAASSYDWASTQVIRDPSAWYHLVLAIDTTQAVESERIKVFLNGERITDYTTSAGLPLNTDTQVNLISVNQIIGARDIGAGAVAHYDGYMSEFNLVDGQQLGPDNFGLFNDQDVWIPKWPVASYGTNGFRLDFFDNSTANTLGTDRSGNGNDFTASGIATNDRMLDTPTDNYPTFNPIADTAGFITYLDGNLIITAPDLYGAVSSFGFDVSENRYAEFQFNFTNDHVGICNEDFLPGSYLNATIDSWTYRGTAERSLDGVISAYGSTASVGDWFGVHVNAGTITVYKNGVSMGVMVSGLSGFHYFTASGRTGTGTIANFGQKTWNYSPPAGATGLYANSLNTPAVAKPSNYFDTVLYTGNAVDNTRIWVQDFKPDLVWIKDRDTAATSHRLFDSTRGAANKLSSDLQNAEAIEANSLKSFDSLGFTLGTGVGSDVNDDGIDYVAWAWRKDPAAGFDIQTYTGTGTSGLTFTHDLGAVPEFMIVKNRDTGTTDWGVYHHKANGGTTPEQYFGLLNTTDVFTNTGGTAYWNDTAPTSTTVTLGNSNDTNAAADEFIAYLWTSIPGFSKMGSYVGNGSADGPFVYTGFKPAFVLMKDSSTGAFGWIIFDNKRGPDNPITGQQLFPNTSAVEGGPQIIDMVSNGFKVRQVNGNADNETGATHIYVAFAEDPFKNTRAR